MSTKLLMQVACLLLPICLQAQFVWDGGAGTTDWHDNSNWNPDIVPTPGSLVEIGTDVTITGFATDAPAQIRVTGGAEVTLDLSMIIGNGIITEHGLVVNANSILNIASGQAIFVNTPIARNGVNIAANNAALNIASGANLVIQQSQHGFRINNSTASITNEGIISITQPSGDGIKLLDGSFMNSGMITIFEAGSDGIENNGDFDNSGDIEIEDADRHGIFNGTGSTFTNTADLTISNPGMLTTDGINTSGTFTNSSSGTITITKMDDDGIGLQEGTFTNDGTINLTVKDAASSGNAGISIGTSMMMATFTNSSTGIVNADGGTSTNGRGVFVYEMGVLDNSGTMTFTNGNSNARLFSRGEVNNEVGGTLDMDDGRININQGTLVNDGLILSTRGTPGVLNSATATNNGFFNYTGSNVFANGSGTTTDNGIDLNDASETTIDAEGFCSVDIAAASYEYFDGMNSVGSTDASGNITFLNVLSNTTVTLTNGLTGVSITIENVCAQALPIELAYFNATPSGKEVLLKWQTTTEINNDYMAVERSSDGRRFTEIGRQAGAGNSDHVITYRLTDRQPLSGRSYYRLRQVDFDGTQSYSEVVSVSFDGNSGQFSVYPTLLTPSEKVTVDLTSVPDGEVILELIDMNGRSVRQFPLRGASTHEISVLGIGKGMYQLRGVDKHRSLGTKLLIM